MTARNTFHWKGESDVVVHLSAKKRRKASSYRHYRMTLATVKTIIQQVGKERVKNLLPPTVCPFSKARFIAKSYYFFPSERYFRKISWTISNRDWLIPFPGLILFSWRIAANFCSSYQKPWALPLWKWTNRHLCKRHLCKFIYESIENNGYLYRRHGAVLPSIIHVEYSTWITIPPS